MLVIQREDVSYGEIANAFVQGNDMSPLEIQICLHCAGYVKVVLGSRAGKEQRRRGEEGEGKRDFPGGQWIRPDN